MQGGPQTLRKLNQQNQGTEQTQEIQWKLSGFDIMLPEYQKAKKVYNRNPTWKSLFNVTEESYNID